MADERQRPKGSPIIKRDDAGRLDRNDAERRTQEIVKKLITEERAFQKDISFNHARGNKRDVFVFITVAHRNSVDGKIVLGDNESKGFEAWSNDDMYKYKVFDYIEAPIMAKEMPLKKSQVGRQLMGCFKVLVNYLARIGAIDGV